MTGKKAQNEPLETTTPAPESTEQTADQPVATPAPAEEQKEAKEEPAAE